MAKQRRVRAGRRAIGVRRRDQAGSCARLEDDPWFRRHDTPTWHSRKFGDNENLMCATIEKLGCGGAIAMKSWLNECREQFEPGGVRGLVRRVGILSRPQFTRVCAGENASASALPHYQALLDDGQIVWGALVQANDKAFAAGNDDLSGVVAYSPDPAFEDDPQAIEAVAARVLALKGQSFDEPDCAQLAGLITDETARFHHARVPESLTAGREVYCSTFLLNRGRLPTGRLVAGLFPLLIDVARTPVVMILPGRYWGRSLRNYWRVAEAKTPANVIMLTAASPMSGAEVQAVRMAYLENPLRLTPAARERVRQIVAQNNLPAETWLRLSAIRVRGMVEYGMKFSVDPLDPGRDLRTYHKDLDVVTDLDSASILKGVTLDFVETIEETGFVFREA
jgi:Fe-S cluster assembly iron-binding protein IscA